MNAKSPNVGEKSQDPGEEVLKEVLETSASSLQSKTNSNSGFFTNGYNSAGEDEETKELTVSDSANRKLDKAAPSIQLPEGVLNRALSAVSLSKEVKVVPVVQCINALSKVYSLM